METFVPYKYNGSPINIERFIILGFEPCEVNGYDIFDLSLSNFAKEKVETIGQNGYESFETYDITQIESLNPFIDATEKKVYLYVEIISTKESRDMLCTQSFANSKLWLNGKCISVNQISKYSYITLDFAKGLNTLILEKLNPTKPSISTILIDDYLGKDIVTTQSIDNLKGYITLDPLTVISTPTFCPQSSKYRFMLFKNQQRRQKYKILITDRDKKTVNKLTGYINEVVEIDLDMLRSSISSELECNVIICYVNDGEKKASINWRIYPNDFINVACELNCELLNQLNAIHSKHIESDIIKLEKVIKNPYWNECFYCFEIAYNYKKFKMSNKSILSAYMNYERQRLREIYIQSCLDDSNIRIGQYVPVHYQKENKYPVIIALSPDINGWFCWMMRNNTLKEECLIFDVTVRGITGGSYVGEASFLEIFEWIKSNYLIDEDRVYLLGYSNGGYATWGIAQNYPHIAAAIFPLCGVPQYENIENACNTPVFQFISPKDYVYNGKYKLIKHSLEKHGNFFETRFKRHTHIDFQYHVINNSVLNNLLAFKRNKYPNKIIFSTCRNRHLKSFWVELHGISEHYKYARIEAEVKNQHKIKVNIRGASGFSIDIPPQVDKEHFDLIINGQTIEYNDVACGTIKVCKRKKWMKTIEVPSLNYRKGTGLLDVYLDRLNVILPRGYSRALLYASNTFSHPCSCGYKPEIYVSYRVYTDDNLPKHIFDNNLIIFDTTISPNVYTKVLDSLLLVRYDNSGYTYKDVKTYGDYLIMQIIKNPFDEKKSILIVSTNNETLLSKCIFTRNMRIPFYINGIHPYLNNMVLIYNGKNYLGIYEEKENLRIIKI